MLRTVLLIGAAAVVSSLVITSPYTKIVQTTSGPIRGLELTFEHTKYNAFRGIPYAAPPLGDLRFKAPEPPERWTDVKDVTNYGHICLQPRRKTTQTKTEHSTRANMPTTPSEDCLTLNVFTKTLGEDGLNLKPVVVFIHGGSFVSGDGTDTIYGPQFLVEQDIVVVTINYRLGPLGFLATNTSDATGNWGLKDQVAALKWVKNNIAQFGGDSDKVTIYGQSAGGASVHFHLFSPLSQGLFHKVIASSGTAYNQWALIDQQERCSKNIARILGASQDQIENPAKRVQFLRSVDPQDLTDNDPYAVDEQDTTRDFPGTFVPVIEPRYAEEAFITEDPRELLPQGKFTKVPLMIGANDLEGALILMGMPINITLEVIREMEKNVCLILPPDLKKAVIAKNDCSKIGQIIREVYFDGESFDSSFLKLLYLFGDIAINQEVIGAQKLHAKYSTESSPLFNYYFTFDGEWNMPKKLMNISLPGAIHGDELMYVFKPSLMELPTLQPSSREVITKDRMISFVGNFVKYGNPTPSVSDLVPVKWESAKDQEPKTLIINENLKLESEILKNRTEMWDNLYKEYIGSSL